MLWHGKTQKSRDPLRSRLSKIELKTIDQVPEGIREEVKKRLEEKA